MNDYTATKTNLKDLLAIKLNDRAVEPIFQLSNASQLYYTYSTILVELVE